MRKFYGNGALNRTLRYITGSFEHDYKITRNLDEEVANPVLAWLAVWIFYLVKVVVYVLHIIPDLLTGYPLWTPEIRVIDIKRSELTELLRKNYDD